MLSWPCSVSSVPVGSLAGLVSSAALLVGRLISVDKHPLSYTSHETIPGQPVYSLFAICILPSHVLLIFFFDWCPIVLFVLEVTNASRGFCWNSDAMECIEGAMKHDTS